MEVSPAPTAGSNPFPGPPHCRTSLKVSKADTCHLQGIINHPILPPGPSGAVRSWGRGAVGLGGEAKGFRDRKSSLLSPFNPGAVERAWALAPDCCSNAVGL